MIPIVAIIAPDSAYEHNSTMLDTILIEALASTISFLSTIMAIIAFFVGTTNELKTLCRVTTANKMIVLTFPILHNVYKTTSVIPCNKNESPSMFFFLCLSTKVDVNTLINEHIIFIANT